jgi:hypothetical protein
MYQGAVLAPPRKPSGQSRDQTALMALTLSGSYVAAHGAGAATTTQTPGPSEHTPFTHAPQSHSTSVAHEMRSHADEYALQ